MQLTVPPEWNLSTEGHNAMWGLILSAPNLLSLVLVVCLEEAATADREVCSSLPSSMLSLLYWSDKQLSHLQLPAQPDLCSGAAKAARKGACHGLSVYLLPLPPRLAYSPLACSR